MRTSVFYIRLKSKKNPSSLLLSTALKEIENETGWGKSYYWSHASFEELSGLIVRKTGIRLSVSTLKRLWGKVEYFGKPQLHTLNALVRYIGYDNWSAFEKEKRNTGKWYNRRIYIYEVLVLLSVIIFCCLLFLFFGLFK